MSLQQVRVVPTREATSALVFDASPEGGNTHITVADCRFEGPYQAVVAFTGPATEIELKRNRFFNTVDGLLYHKVEPVAPLRLTLSNNTFSSVENVGLHFETTPNRESSRIALVGNLFARTDTLAPQ